MMDIWFYLLSMYLFASCTDHWGEEGVTILEFPCLWDLSVDARLTRIGQITLGSPIDTDNSSNSKNVRVWYTVFDVPNLEFYFHPYIDPR